MERLKAHSNVLPLAYLLVLFSGRYLPYHPPRASERVIKTDALSYDATVGISWRPPRTIYSQSTFLTCSVYNT